MPSPSETDLIRRWVETWRRAGDELDKIKAEELRALTEEKSAEYINDALLMADYWLALNPGETRECGMVEQQRIFQKWHRNRT